MKKLILLSVFLICYQSVFADDLAAVVTNSDFSLDNGAIDLSVSGGVTPYIFSWTGPGGFVSADEDISGLTPGDYCVTVTDKYCGIAELCVTVEEEIPTTSENGTSSIPVKIFPNPFNNSFAITMSVVTGGNYTFQFMDESGKTIFEEKHYLHDGNNQIDFQLPQIIPAGTYRIKLKNVNGELLTLPLVRIK